MVAVWEKSAAWLRKANAADLAVVEHRFLIAWVMIAQGLA
jgi:hypothetical protein